VNEDLAGDLSTVESDPGGGLSGELYPGGEGDAPGPAGVALSAVVPWGGVGGVSFILACASAMRRSSEAACMVIRRGVSLGCMNALNLTC